MTWYAVVAGTNYRGQAGQLQGCEHDVDTNAALHGSMGAHVTFLKGPQATRAAILSTLADALADAGPDDGVEFDWSGHGSRQRDRDGDERDGWDEVICPDDHARSGMILDDQLYELTAPAFARGVRVVLKLDSCYSGTFHRMVGDPADSYTVARWLPPAMWLDPDQIERAAELWEPPRGKSRPGALAFSACRDNQLANETLLDGKPQGVLTYYSTQTLLTLLEQGGVVNYRDWCRATVALVNDPDQVPVLDGTASQKRWLVGQERGRR
jgi:hypothetical protein